MRAREHGVAVGLLAPGPGNAITDVPGVGVGHAGPRDHTGVTAIVPRLGRDAWLEPCFAGAAILNGAGELSGLAQVLEWGVIETPILLTATPYVGAVYDAATQVLQERQPRIGRIDGDVLIPIVGECDPSAFCDCRDGERPGPATVRAALDGAASSAVAEGQVGAGVGMSGFGWAGGIGTASRRLETGETVGVLLLVNFGDAERLTVAGRVVGHALPDPASAPKPGSCIAVVGTDAPLLSHDLGRLARRAFLGLARTGSYASHGSGELAIAFSTANGAAIANGATERRRRVEVLAPDALSDVFAAATEAAEEAVLNALAAGRRLVGATGGVLEPCPFAAAAALARGEPGR